MPPALLIVDDEPQLLRLLVRVFERADYTVLAAADGDEALALLDAHADALVAVVLDVLIPPRGAAEVLEAIVARRPGLGVVVVSGDRLEPPLAARLAEVGGAFLRKPFRPEAVTERVAAFAARAPGAA